MTAIIRQLLDFARRQRAAEGAAAICARSPRAGR